MGNELVKQRKNALQCLAARLDVSEEALKQTLQKTAFKSCNTDEEFISAVIVANTYQLNPILKEMYVFPAKGGGVTPIVSIDGWISLVNRQSNFDGCELIENFEGDKLASVTATFYLKERTHPVIVTEYMDECCNDSKEPWKKWPKRMLRHKAYIQGARVAFGFSGIYDPDEAERIQEAEVVQVNDAPIERPKAKQEAPAAQPAPVEETPQSEAPEKLYCNCGTVITKKVYDYSTKKHGVALCMSCQKAAGNGIN